MKPVREFMQQAIDIAAKTMGGEYGGPFGACIVKDGKVVSVASNSVLICDPTAHAEINAIREAACILGTHDLSGCQIYSTTEPCPMCFSAIHWAKIDAVIFGTSIADAAAAGFNELPISNYEMKTLGKSPVEIYGDFMKEECSALFVRWRAFPSKKSY
jgi:guanine deaminase